MDPKTLKLRLNHAFDNRRLWLVKFRDGSQFRALIDDWALDSPDKTGQKLHAFLMPLDPSTHGKTTGCFYPLDSFASIEPGEQIDVETWHKMNFGEAQSGTIAPFDGPREY